MKQGNLIVAMLLLICGGLETAEAQDAANSQFFEKALHAGSFSSQGQGPPKGGGDRVMRVAVAQPLP